MRATTRGPALAASPHVSPQCTCVAVAFWRNRDAGAQERWHLKGATIRVASQVAARWYSWMRPPRRSQRWICPHAILLVARQGRAGEVQGPFSVTTRMSPLECVRGLEVVVSVSRTLGSGRGCSPDHRRRHRLPAAPVPGVGDQDRARGTSAGSCSASGGCCRSRRGRASSS